jgi:hypothetical protein
MRGCVQTTAVRLESAGVTFSIGIASRTEKLAAEFREQADEARAAAEESAAGRSAAENELEQLK